VNNPGLIVSNSTIRFAAVRRTGRLAIHTLLALGVSFAITGCKTIKSKLGLSKKSDPPPAAQQPKGHPGQDFFPPPGKSTPGTPTVTPNPRPVQPAGVRGGQGKVLLVDKALGFIVADFAYSQMPPAEQRYLVYRGNLQVGEVMTTGMTDETFLVADINKGDIREGDIIRPE